MIANKTNVSSAKSRYRDISTAALHIIAMLFMLMGRSLGYSSPGAGLADLCWKGGIPYFCIYDSRGVFSYS